MLESLKVKNLALIEEAEVEFGRGLNVLTGETGAGKSILIGSINLALGAKADKDIIRTGEEYAYVELIFYTENENVQKKAEKMDIYPEDNRFIISRKISLNKSISKINGETVTVKQVKELAEVLLDIHGQHEHQSLLKETKQKDILDLYCAAALKEWKEQLKQTYKEYKAVKEELAEEGMDENERKREISLAEFECREIADAKLLPGEDLEVEKLYKKMNNAKKILESVGYVLNCMGNDSEQGAGSLIGRAMRELKSIEGYDEEALKLSGQLMEIEDYVSDFNHHMQNYMETLEFDGKDFRETEERLNLINHLKAKYGNSIEKILQHKTDCEEMLNKLVNYENNRERLQKQEEELQKKVKSLCKEISKIRKEKAACLEKEIKEALIKLNFLQVEFEIVVKADESNLSADGYDSVQMLISTNPGEKLKPLSAVVSGGELSRIMLAIKEALATKDEIDTLVFDEIDTGISGKTAWMVSEKMGNLAGSHQILCITHLPQIAARANRHLLIEKSIENEGAVTKIKALSEEESIEELSRMLGGINITDTVRKSAAEMKKMAKNEL